MTHTYRLFTGRLYTERFYILMRTPGISGFQRWDEQEYALVAGARARLNRAEVLCEYRATARGLPPALDRLRLSDGHLPDHQPIVNGLDALAWIAANPTQEAVFLHNPLKARPQ